MAGILSAVAMVAAPSASATDTGGDGNPYTDCTGGYTAASAPIYEGGTVIGLVELRWSYACSGNWTRTTSYVGSRELLSFISTDPYTESAEGDDVATQNFSPYLRVAPAQRMCATGYINIGDNYYGNEVCSG